MHTSKAPWAKPGSDFTLLLAAFALLLSPQTSVLATAYRLGIHDMWGWALIEHDVGQARQSQDLTQVHDVGIDEVADRRGHDYVTLGTDHI